MKRYLAIWMLTILFTLSTLLCYGADREHIRQQPENTHLAIFVHGFTGDYLETWGKLPQLLQDDPSLDSYDFLFWGYPTKLFFPSETIETVGEHLKTEIKFPQKPYTKIVLIGHSMGGLVIRSFILQALIDGKGDELNNISEVILFGTPNDGLSKSSFIPKIINKQIVDMRVASEFITKLRKYWINRVFKADINDDYNRRLPLVTVAGLSDRFVPKDSVESFFPNMEVTDGDHISMVKPQTTSHLTYRIIHRRLLEVYKKKNTRADNLKKKVEERVPDPLPGLIAKLLSEMSKSNRERSEGSRGGIFPNLLDAIEIARAAKEGWEYLNQISYVVASISDPKETKKKIPTYLQPGDIIYQMNNQVIRNAEHFRSEVEYNEEDRIDIYIIRGGSMYLFNVSPSDLDIKISNGFKAKDSVNFIVKRYNEIQVKRDGTNASLARYREKQS